MDNVVLFPKWQARLERESFEALQNRRFEDALAKIEQLMQYNIDHHDIAVGKLICLMELGRYDEAEAFGESLLEKKNQDYYRYLFIYFNILLHIHDYEQLAHLIQRELKKSGIPGDIKQQLIELYHESLQRLEDYREERETELYEDLNKAMLQGKLTQQWRIIESLRENKSHPTKMIKDYLRLEHIHPMIKTALLMWLKDMNVTDDVTIKKLGLKTLLKPLDLPELTDADFYQEVLTLIQDIEHKNPTLFQLLEKVLYRFTYVRYPFFPPSEDAPFIAQALKTIAQPYLDDDAGEVDPHVEKYVEEMKWCETLFLSVIED